MKLAWMLALGVAALAQQHSNPAGFGSVLYPGTGGPPPPQAHGGAGSVLYPGTGGPPGRNLIPRGPVLPITPAHMNHTRNVIVPVPVYYYGPANYDYSQQQAPAYTYEEPAQSPVTIVNPSYVGDEPLMPYRAPSYRDSSTSGEVRPDAPPTIYLLAMTDQTILPAIAYWADGDTLSYITPEGNQNRVSLALIDREFSKKLNDDRHVEFRLPKQ
jgi:hypothetical protein